MIQITPQMRIWLAVEPVDFRKGIEGLAALCRQQLKADPMSGTGRSGSVGRLAKALPASHSFTGDLHRSGAVATEGPIGFIWGRRRAGAKPI